MKDENEFWLLNLAKKLEASFFNLLILFLPTQFGKHFWPDFSYVIGQRVDYLSPTFYVTDIFLLGLFVSVFFQQKIRVHAFFSLFVLFLSVNIFLSFSPFVGWYFFAKFLEVSFLVWYVATYGVTKKTGILLACGLMMNTLLAAGQLLQQHSLGGIFYFLGERSFSAETPGIANASVAGQLFLRPYGTFSHPNILAGYFVVVIFLVLYFFTKEKFLSVKLLSILSIVMGALTIILSLSRVATISLVLGMLLLVQRKNMLKTISIGIIMMGIFLVTSSLFFPEVIYRFLPSAFGQSVSERIVLMNAAISLFLKSPLIGVGLGNFLPLLPIVSRNEIILQPVHNIFYWLHQN